MNPEIRKLLEEARSLAAALPQFEGMETVKKLNELLGLRPTRLPGPRFWPRIVEDEPGEAA